MRLSALVIASLLCVSSTLVAEHSTSSGSSSSASSGGSSSSHSSSSGGSSSSSSHNSSSSANSAGSHNSSSSASHVSGTSGASSRFVPSNKGSSTRESKIQQQKVGRTFWHPFRKEKPVSAAIPRLHCPKGPCPVPVCRPGQSASRGGCVVTASSCSAGQIWNGFSCGLQYWSNDCTELANRLAAQRRLMQGQNDPGQTLIYRTLLKQYEACTERYGGGFFNSYASLSDIP